MDHIVLFFTHSGAIKFEIYLEGKGMSGRTMPVPRKLSSSCGVCNLFSTDELKMEGMNLEDIDRIYKVDGSNYFLIYEGE